MRRLTFSLFLVALAPGSASAEGVLGCRWQPGATAIAYSAELGDGSVATDVRALIQGARLADASGAPPVFASLTPAQPTRRTDALFCTEGEAEPADGMIELTFSRRVRLGIEYTLGKCQLFYRCPAAAAAPAAPALYLGFVAGAPPSPRPAAPLAP
jgi:hypothetical protein